MMAIARLVMAVLIAGACMAAAPQRGKPQPPPPKPAEQAQALVAELYRAHLPSTQGKGTPVYANRQQRGRFFSPELIALIERAEEEERKTGALVWNADPITDSQTPEVRELRLTVEQASETAAVVVARFEQHRARTTVTYRLVRTKAGWRIDDILGGRSADPQWSLRALFAPAK